MNFDKLERKLMIITLVDNYDINLEDDCYHITCKNYNDEYLPIEAVIDVIGKSIEYNLLNTCDTPFDKLGIDMAQIEDLQNFINILMGDI